MNGQPSAPMKTYRYPCGEGVKCGGCNWETTALYVLASSQEEADQLLRNAYGCARCQALEWEHLSDAATHGVPDHDYEERDEADGGGLCGECYASMLADRDQGVRYATR